MVQATQEALDNPAMLKIAVNAALENINPKPAGNE
jgi:hypothetical protein